MPLTPLPTDANDYIAYSFDEATSPWQTSRGVYNPMGRVDNAVNVPSVPGLFGNCLSVIGPNTGFNYYNAGTNGYAGAYGQEYTCSAWFYPTGAPGQIALDTYIAGHGLYTLPSGWHGSTMAVFCGAGGVFKGAQVVGASYPPNYGTEQYISGGTVLLNQWNFIALTYKAGTWKLYGNGQLVATRTGIGSVCYQGGQFYVGGSPAGVQTFTGKIDEFRIASIARDATWVSQAWATANPGRSYIYQQQPSGTPAALINDNVPLVDVPGPNTYIWEDLNAIRSQVNRVIGKTAWSDQPTRSLQQVTVAKGKFTGANVSGGVLNFSSLGALPAGYDAEADINVFLNGLMLTAPDDYSVPTSTTVSFVASSLTANDLITIMLRKKA